jgi:hypothetical protein
MDTTTKFTNYLFALFSDSTYVIFLFIGVLEGGPPLSTFSIDFTVFFAAIVSVMLLVSVVVGSHRQFSRDILIAQGLLIGLLAWLAISLLWAPASNVGPNRVIKAVVGLSIAFGYPIWMIGHDTYRIDRLLWIITGFGILLAVLFFIWDPILIVVPNRISLARPIGLATVILTARVITSQGRSTVIYVAIIPILIFALLKNGSRAPAGSAVISCGAIVVWGLINKRKIFNFSRWLLLLIPVLIVFFSDYFQSDTSSTVQRFMNLLNGGGTSVISRLHYYDWSISSWLSSPLSAVIGEGVGAFAVEYNGLGSSATYPHNIFVELAISGGFIALLLYMSFLWIVLKGIGSSEVSDHPVHIGVIGITVFMILNSQVTGDIYINKYLFLALSLLSLTKLMQKPHLSQ